MAAPAAAAAGSTAGSTAGATAAKTAGTTASKSALASSAMGAAGGLIDSLGISATGWIDRARYQKSLREANEFQRQQAEQNQINIDRAFNENVRQYGLNYALNEYSTRKGISLQEARDKYNMAQQARTMPMQLDMMRGQVMDQKKRQRIGNAFAKGFDAGYRGA